VPATIKEWKKMTEYLDDKAKAAREAAIPGSLLAGFFTFFGWATLVVGLIAAYTSGRSNEGLIAFFSGVGGCLTLLWMGTIIRLLRKIVPRD
jgi:hypothetical protein